MSKVYFSDFRCKSGQSQLDKLERLITEAGIDKIDFTDKYVAVKLHFGEWGNLAFLRQQYAKVLCDHIKARGGKPFLTDCNTLYPGYRHNALDHLNVAYMNGYNPMCTGVQTIIADGLRGTDERLIPVEGAKYVKEAKIGSAIAEADIVISLTHFKGHDNAGFGGTLKNIGMGCGSKRGKMEMHSNSTPEIDESKCVGCGMCAKNCLNAGVKIEGGKAHIVEDKCLGCGHCFSFCPRGAIECKWDEATSVMNCKIAEYAKAVLMGKPQFHISFVKDVSPNCDCDPGNDAPIIPNVGMFASFDPVALDRACVDKANEQKPFENSAAGKMCECGKNHELFAFIHPNGDWKAGLVHAEKLGMGTMEYELIRI